MFKLYYLKNIYCMFQQFLDTKTINYLYQLYCILCEEGYKNQLPIIVCVGHIGKEYLLDAIRYDPLVKDLFVVLVNVNDKELCELYKNACFCVYPSFYEGWGMPVAEALSLGKHVLCSNRGALPEVASHYATCIDPYDMLSWKNTILQWIQQPNIIAEKENYIKKYYKPHTWG